ncbi:unnamed protein product [Lactuca saligna]|uniref:Uncharacterized protein n=1 Tax=Lactuca saligna TaxID=75948 RepID=A0AA35ZU27_LACSI|nr:unnamed protein product [Lactuca saligna]
MPNEGLILNKWNHCLWIGTDLIKLCQVRSITKAPTSRRGVVFKGTMEKERERRLKNEGRSSEAAVTSDEKKETKQRGKGDFSVVSSMGGVAVGISDEPMVVSFSSPVARNRWNDQLLQSLIRAVPTAIREGRQGGSSPVVLLGVLRPIRKKKGKVVKGKASTIYRACLGGTRQERRKKRGCYILVSTRNQHTSDVLLGSHLENEAKEGKGEVLPLSLVIRRVGDGGSHKFFFPCRWYPRT